MNSWFDSDIKFLKGVGEQRAALLARELGIHTLGDLLYYFPFRYIDRTKLHTIGELNSTQSTTYVQLKVRVMNFQKIGAGAKARLSVLASDGTGRIELLWFKGIKWIESRIEVGREYIVFGKPSFFRGEASIVHPELDNIGAPNTPAIGMQGVYGTTEKLSSSQLGSKGIYKLVATLWRSAEEHITESLPQHIIDANGLMPLREALRNIHFPQSAALLAKAEYRLKFDELFGIQLDIVARGAQRTARADGFPMPRVGEFFNRFYREKLPFELTGAQKRVIKEIRGDMVGGQQMNRLLQGDVGSGKTMVALTAMLIAADNGYQSCLMAPTEILARQHYATLVRMTEGLGIEIGVLTGASKTAERRDALEGLQSGRIRILVGTHALLEDKVIFDNLGVVVIDEQHRFGVEQRSRMWTKNTRPPHILVMSATPIPRTLAMTLYGDLEVSVIDELPPGRKPIKTVHMSESHRLALFGFIHREIAKGRQVYVVYPLIRESETMDYRNLYEGYEAITDEFKPPHYCTAVVHGKMSNDEKEASMALFKNGTAHILVATSVIEVGVDGPNATVMVIESAERFGLSQLHQLRGRVGRGGEQSYCVLMSGDKLSADARKRLGAMVETCDGFELAELDMKLRGSGDISGTQQSGTAFDLKIADISRDGQIIEHTRRIAREILERDPYLSEPQNRLLAALAKRYAPKAEADFSMIS